MAKKPPKPGSPAWWSNITAHPQTATPGGFGILGDPRVHAQYGFPAFKPYQPPPVPAGFYDPALDAQRGAASRGITDLGQDVGLAGRRAQEDYNTNVGLLTKHYQDLGTAQNERANAYGVVPGGGAMLQAEAKRAANQALEQTALTTDYNRGVADRATQLGRAQREDAFFGTDINAQKLYQAQQAGYVSPTTMPRNEHITASGGHTRTATVGHWRYTYGPHGQILSKKRVK